MYPFYLGIDLHLKRTYMVLMDSKGEVVDKQRISNNKIGDYLKERIPRKTYAVLEATRNWPFMYYDLLHEHVEQVDLVHAKGVRAIANAAVKTDQIDASTLAHLAPPCSVTALFSAVSSWVRCIRRISMRPYG